MYRTPNWVKNPSFCAAKGAEDGSYAPRPPITLPKASHLRELGDSTRRSYGIVANALRLRTEVTALDDLGRNMQTARTCPNNLQAPAIEDKFRTYPFVVMVVFSGAQPQSVTLPCDEFERLWERAAKADELE